MRSIDPKAEVWRELLEIHASLGISIVVPTLNEAEHILATLDSLGPLREGDQCILVDGGSTDGTVDLVLAKFPEVEILEADTAGRAIQMNLGAKQARGDVLLFLHGDCRLPPAGLDDIRHVMAGRNVDGGSFYLKFDRSHWVLDLSSQLSRVNSAMTTYGDQGFFFRRDFFEQIGGFQKWPLFEDLAIQLLARRRGQICKLPTPVLSSARRYARRGPVRQQLLNVLLVLLFRLGVSPHWLAGIYRPRKKTG